MDEDSSQRSYGDRAERRSVASNTIFTENPCNAIDVGRVLDAVLRDVPQSERARLRHAVTDYIKMGWHAVSGQYVAAKGSSNDITEDLRLLGTVRKHMVAQVFECYKHDNVHMGAFGSQNLTSDYDVSLMGPNSAFTMWSMFESFVAHYHSTLATAMDVNIYANGMYERTTSKDVTPGMRKVVLDDTAFALTPTSTDAADTMVTWALVKVLEGVDEIMLADHPDGYGHEDAMREFVHGVLPADVTRHVAAAERKLASAIELRELAVRVAHEHYQHEFVFGDAPAAAGVAGYELSEDSYAAEYDYADHHDSRYLEFIGIVADYGLQFHYAYLLNQRLYHGVDTLTLRELGGFLEKLLPAIPEEELTLAELLCRNMYYSVEAAYTQGAVNVVVHEMQQGKALDLEATDYLCSVVENYGELLKHVGKVSYERHDMMPLADKALKYSKYVHRMLHSLAKYGRDDDLLAEAEAVRSQVVKKRDARGGDVDLDAVYFSHDQERPYEYLKAVAAALRSRFPSASQSGGAWALWTTWAVLSAVTVAAAACTA